MNFDVNGTQFHGRVDGQSGPWVILIHGLACDLTMWDELAAALADRYRVLRYDARGHGQSAATPGDYSLDLLVTDAVAIMDVAGIERAHIGGLSMGGMVTQGLLLDHPDRVISATIADSRHTTTPAFTTAWLERAETVRQHGVEAVVVSTVERWSSAGLAERRPDLIARMERMVRATSPDGYCGCAAALARLNYGPRLGEITTPALVICGSEDHGAPPENTRQMHRMIKGSRFLEIEQAGHIANIEQPARFNAAVRDFIEEHDAA
ncbi:MAG: alpha/beta fold hydrolase [Rhodopseudomonas sp.]|nr:alpha/beta fold hydrolase [Rhodopseudomonas sp.]